MFKKSNKEPQINLFGGASVLLKGSSLNQYNDENHWHNQFYNEVFRRIDESSYKVLFKEKMGAPNTSISLLIGMMIIKEAFDWSDWQLFEQCRFNLLVRGALGLCNINDTVPAESTYYLLRKRIYDHHKQTDEDLLEKTFKQITQGQIKDFQVNGQCIRMDSKLIGSNIAYFSRYEIIHRTLVMFCKTLDDIAKSRLSAADREQLKATLGEESSKTVYRSTRQEIISRSDEIGLLIYKLLNTYPDNSSQSYQLLKRVFEEQYKVADDQQIVLRPKEEITSSSLQSPHDPDSAYRHKKDNKVKGYSMNLTETISDTGLNLITNVTTEKANVPDNDFVKKAIESTVEVTGQLVEKCYADGAYQSPDNDPFCKDIDMVYTGIQGNASRFDLQMTPEGLLVCDTQTGESYQGVLAKKLKNSKEDRYRIDTPEGKFYFGQQAIRASELRRRLKERSTEELNMRNNVEASIFQLGYHLHNNKTKYRRQFKQSIWANCRCLWINLVRIMKFTKQTCQRTPIILDIKAINTFFYQIFSFLTKYLMELKPKYQFYKKYQLFLSNNIYQITPFRSGLNLSNSNFELSTIPPPSASAQTVLPPAPEMPKACKYSPNSSDRREYRRKLRK